MDDEAISAFAFNTGREIERIINERTNNLEEKNQLLEFKILEWYMITKDEKFADYFGIKEVKSGT